MFNQLTKNKLRLCWNSWTLDCVGLALKCSLHHLPACLEFLPQKMALYNPASQIALPSYVLQESNDIENRNEISKLCQLPSLPNSWKHEHRQHAQRWLFPKCCMYWVAFKDYSNIVAFIIIWFLIIYAYSTLLDKITNWSHAAYVTIFFRHC